MATMIERQAESIRREIEKLTKSLDTHTARLAKKEEKAKNLDALWTMEEWFGGKRETGTAEQIEAWDEWTMEHERVDDLARRIGNAQKRLDKISGKVEAQQEATAKEAAEVERIGKIETKWITITPEQQKENAAKREEEYQKWLAEFKADCLKDGIIIDEASHIWINGTAANGKRFYMEINNGYTVRSNYCYTLKIEGRTVFTSGEFLTAYRYLMQK